MLRVTNSTDRYFNVVQDGNEFRVRSVSRIIQPNEDTNVFHYKNYTSTYSINPGTRFYYQPSRTIGDRYSHQEGILRGLSISGIQVRPQIANEPIAGDLSGTGDITGVNCSITSGTEGSRYYGIIYPKLVGNLREDIRFTTTVDGVTDAEFKIFNTEYSYSPDLLGVQYVDVKSGSFGEGNAIFRLKCSAWFLIYVNNVFTIPQNGGISISVLGEYRALNRPVSFYNCPCNCRYKTILGNLSEGYIIVYSDLTNDLEPDYTSWDHPELREYWRDLNWITTPKLKVFFNSNGYVRICQWGYEIGADYILP